MNKRKGLMLAGMALALGIWATAAPIGQGADDDDKETLKEAKQAQADVLKLMATMDKGGNPSADAAAIKSKFSELKPSMYIFKPRARGGLGIGPMGKRDGIEFKIMDLSSKKPPTAAEVAKEMEDYIKIAKVSKAMAEVTDQYLPKKDANDWKKFTQEMRKGADQLIAAAKKGDPAAIKKAATTLNASCTDCHGKFRD
jgi:cytochrome c556